MTAPHDPQCSGCPHCRPEFNRRDPHMQVARHRAEFAALATAAEHDHAVVFRASFPHWRGRPENVSVPDPWAAAIAARQESTR